MKVTDRLGNTFLWGEARIIGSIINTKQRVVALLLFLVFISSVVIPPVSVYALLQDEQKAAAQAASAQDRAAGGAKAHIKQYDEKQLSKPMKQNYAAPAEEKPAPYTHANQQISHSLTAPGTAFGQPIAEPGAKPSKKTELLEQRTANRQVFRNPDGTHTATISVAPKFYKKNGQWQAISAKLVEDKNAGDASNPLAKLYGQALAAVDPEQAFIMEDNDWKARFSPSDFAGGMLRVQQGSEQLGFTPVGAKRVAPVLGSYAGKQAVYYYDLWPGVDVRYTVSSARVKEDIIIKHKQATTDFSFRLAGGARLQAQAGQNQGFAIKNLLGDDFALAPLTLDLQLAGPVDQPVYHQEYKNDTLRVWIDNGYIQSLGDAEFPAVLDPTIGPSSVSANVKNYRSDGTSCIGASCGIRAGSVNDSGWKSWRSVFFGSYNNLLGPLPTNTQVLDASVYVEQSAGTSNVVGFQLFHASCNNAYACYGTLAGNSSSVDYEADLDAHGIYQGLVAAGDSGGWLMLRGQECGCTSYKTFDAYTASVNLLYNIPPTAATPEAPGTDPNTEYVVTSTQPTVGVTTATDADGDEVQYDYYLAATTGTVLYSTGKTPVTRLTIPEGLLQDGGSYIWKYSVSDGPNYDTGWQNGGKFRVDLRTGKDKTSTYQDVGPVSISMNTGNVYTSAGTHSMKALDGSIGLSLNYNSPYASQPGLRASYYAGTAWGTTPLVTRTEATVDNNWGNGTPAQNIVPDNNFSAEYKGYFVAPVAGNYEFGAINDDALTVTVGTTQVYNATSGCYSTCWGGTTVALTEGQVVPLLAKYIEYTGQARVQLSVRGPVTAQVIPSDYLRTEVLPTDANTGLMGHYYVDNSTHDPTQPMQKFMTRKDPIPAFGWDTVAPAPGTPADNYYVRWEGYFTAPVAASYYFGTKADDGSRVTVNGTQVMSNWVAGNYTLTDYYGSAISLSAGQTVPIKIEYFEVNGSASFQLIYKTNLNTTSRMVEPQYLSPGGKFLPSGWNLSADADGNLAYERIEVRQNGDVLTYDADGSTQLFVNTGSGFKPPLNEEATLLRNADGTHTLTDADGRIYVFNIDGTLRETTAPIDDRKPAALRYVYATVNGMPRLTEIQDGVNTSRKGNVYYQGDSQCGSVPSGYDAVPANQICAFVTSDGQRTDFQYGSDKLKRIAQPGSAMTNFDYQSDGMLLSLTDTLANDAVAAGVRTNNATVKTELEYDTLARANKVTAPAATASASRTAYSLDYLPGKSRIHVVGSTEPNGYSQYIEYDQLLRTTKVCDVAALCGTTEWHTTKDLDLSSTDATGLKTTTLYDDDDKPTHQYGPAPTAWFGTDRQPLTTPTNYTAQVPHTETTYDSGLAGPAVAWYDYKRAGTEPGVLFGAPKIHTTGITPSTPGTMTGDLTTPPFTMTSGMQGIGLSATGKLRLPAGNYNINVETSEGIRVWVDDTLVLDAWQDAGFRTVNGSTFTVASGQVKRFRLDTYRKVGSTGNFLAWIKQSGGFDWTTNWSSYLSPNYMLNTSSKVYDATLGNSIATTSYGSTPELSLPASSSVDPTGLNLTTTNTYEAPGATDSFLRQTHKYLPGANTATASTATQYSYYGPTDTKDNPCTTGTTEVFKQAGFLKLKTEPDPDGTGSQTGRKTETIYDDTGRVVATRYNSDSWTCTTYDTRGRATQTVIPAFNGNPARTVTNYYAVSGNPLQTASADANGTIVTTIDLLGRTVDYADVYGYWTGYEYNVFGDLTRKFGDMGEEVFYYDANRRLSQHLFDGVTYATVTYEAYGRVDYVDYNNAGQMRLTYGRDALGRTVSQTYRLGNGTTTVADTVSRTQSGQITSDTITSGSATLAASYTYDGADRLTGATIGTNTYSYGFGAQNSSCGTGVGTNTNSGKNSNRTTQTINGTTSTFCYDYADRLTSSSNTLYNTPTYDSHGNMMAIGTGTTPLNLYYDSSDRSAGYDQTNASGTGVGIYYDRDASGRIIGRYKSTITTWNWASAGDWFYAFTGAGDTPDFVLDTNMAVVEKSLSLPGGVMLTVKPQESVTNNKKQYSLPNVHGDTLLLTNAAGTNTSTGSGPANAYAYDPFGNAITGSVLPANTSNASYGWVGQHQKITETEFALKPIPMGARVYLPGIGRFTQVDTVEGGVENNYVYPVNPISLFDIEGTLTRSYSVSFCDIICGSTGLVFDDNHVYMTLGVGVGTPGGGVSMTYGPGNSSESWSITGSGGINGVVLGASYNGKLSYEVGAGQRGGSIGIQRTACFNCWRPKAKKQTPIKDPKFVKDIKSGRFKREYNDAHKQTQKNNKRR